MEDYLEAGTIVFLFSIAEWLESRASHKVLIYYFSCFKLA
jgi:Cd2+/Zn2+-exporting ATPase